MPARSASWTSRLAAAVLVTLALAGCGGSTDDGAAPDEAAADETEATGDSFQPVTIEHRYGSTEVSEAPERIVSLDPQWTDVLLALDVTPVGHITHIAQEDETFPWQGDLLSGSEPLLYVDALPYEAIAGLDPDLILGTYAVQDETQYDTLATIAPTIASLSDAEVESWQDLAAATGEVLGRERDAEQLVDDADAEVAAVRDELPGLDGKTIAFANYLPGDSLVVLADPDDGANVLFSQLGLDLAPGVVAEGGDATGRVTVSLERLDILDGDILVVLANGADVSTITGWDQLPAVQSGAAVVIDQTQAVALNTPSPLSVPYGLETIRPALEIAAG